ncbi:MAG: YfcE family phosphodiesterase [Candidatus Colwellbacteria bacterium]
MKYAVFSDSHDNFYNLEQAIKLVKERNITTVFHLGDFCAPGAVRTMTAHKDLKWICVWGNNEGAKAQIVLEQKNNPNFDVANESFRELEIEGKKIFLVHFPELARHAALTGEYQAVFYGHDHQKKVEKLENGTLLANPGELAGFATGQPSFGIWDAKTNEFEIVDLTDFKTTKV